MKPILKSILLLAATLSAPLSAPSTRALDDTNPDDCPRPVEADGLSMCLFDGGTDPWLDQAWDQTGPNTWTNPEDGTVSTWVETAPNDYEIVDANPQAQHGAVVPVPPPPPPPVIPPPPPPETPTPVLPGAPPLDITIGDYTLDGAHWPGAVTGREGPYGVTRLVGQPPTKAQYAELELAWAVHKANTTRPYARVGVLVSEVETFVAEPPPPAPENELAPWYGLDHALVQKARAAAAEREQPDEELPPSYELCAPECGPIWDGYVVLETVASDAGGFIFGGLAVPEGGMTFEWIEDTIGLVLERLDHYDLERVVEAFWGAVDKPAILCDEAGECQEIGEAGFGYNVGRVMHWFLDLVNPRDGTLLTEGEALYRETVEAFMGELLVDALNMVARGELTSEQAASAVMALGLRYHEAVARPPLLPAVVGVSELGGLRPVTGALYVSGR